MVTAQDKHSMLSTLETVRAAIDTGSIRSIFVGAIGLDGKSLASWWNIRDHDKTEAVCILKRVSTDVDEQLR